MDTLYGLVLEKAINTSENGYNVTTAYTVSHDFLISAERLEKYTTEISNLGIEVMLTLEELLSKVNFVLLYIVDGRLHLEQAEKILKAGNTVFIDKAVAVSLKEVIEIFDLLKKYNAPMFTSSALRFIINAQSIRKGNIGKVLRADTFKSIPYQSIFPDLYWYGIYGLELSHTLMKLGCKKIKRFMTNNYDLVTGVWVDGRIGNYRGMKNGEKNRGTNLWVNLSD